MSEPPLGAQPLGAQALAAIDLLRRTGSSTFEIRYSEPEHDNSPTVWIAISGYLTDAHGHPVATGHPNAHEVAAALVPEEAIFRLCDQLIDGGWCKHCNRPAGFERGMDPLPLSDHICWYQWDPELKSYRRSCEGDT